MKKADLNFKDSHDENGIPKCCMTCAHWSFRYGRDCKVNVDDLIKYNKVCSSWEISEHYKGGKHEPILSEAASESEKR